MIFQDMPRPRREEERILPLINVVFLLFIFFMLAGSLSASDPFEVTPPVSSSDAGVETQDILILIGPEGELAIDGISIGLDELQDVIAERVVAEEPPIVWLKGDAQSDALLAVSVLERLQAAGVAEVTLLTVPGAE